MLDGKSRRRAAVVGGWLVAAALVGGTVPAAAATVPAQATPAPAVPGAQRYIVALKDAVTDPAATATAQTRSAGATVRGVYQNAVKAYVADVPPSGVAAIQRDPATQFVVPDRVVRRTERPSRPVTAPPACNVDPATNAQFDPRPCWLRRVGGDRSSTRSGDGKGTVNVNVAVIDDGIDQTNADLDVVGGTDCRSGTPQGGPVREAEHGTEVAGVLAARDNGFGVTGIAPGTPLYGVTIFNSDGTTSLSAVLCGVEWVAGTRKDRDPRNDVEVANMSFGDDEGDDTPQCGIPGQDVVHLAICRGTVAGVTYVASAGNETKNLDPPSVYTEVLAATAMADFDGVPGGRNTLATCFGQPYHQLFGDVDDAPAYFSNFATTTKDRLHTVAAPGACIATTYPTGDPNTYSISIVDGTSFASPIVAGTAALCISSGKCRRGQAVNTIATLVAGANAYTARHRDYGFTGDPVRPVPGRYYGPLIDTLSY